MNMTTSNEIETPSFGGKMRASWGAAVTRAVNAHEAELQSLRRTGKWESARFEGWTTPRPFEVRQVWVSEEGSTAKVAKWCIFLPSNSLYIAQSAVDATDGLTAANGAPAGWYELPEFPDEGESGSVYLHVTLPDDVAEDEIGEETESEGEDESHEAEAEIVTEFGEQGERDVYIEIATVASDGKVLQKVVGTLVVGKDGNIGVTSLNELTGDVTIEGGDGVEVEEDGQTIRISLTGDEGEGDDDYCNAISGDFGGGGGGHDKTGGGGNAIANDDESGGEDNIGNDISKWPCDSGAEGEAAAA